MASNATHSPTEDTRSESRSERFFGYSWGQLRVYQIIEAAKKYERMQMARFYFKSSEFFRDNLPDERSHHDYFKTLEDSKSKDKVKIRQTINIIVRDIESFAELELSEMEKYIFCIIRDHYKVKTIFANFDKRIRRWPRIYVDDSNYRENDGLFNDSLTYQVIPEVYSENDHVISEIDYNQGRTTCLFEEIKIKRRPKNKFKYKNGKVKLDFVKNVTTKIERAIMEKLKSQFKLNDSKGFSTHHVIPRKKLEIFFSLLQMGVTTLPTDTNDAACVIRRTETERMGQLYHQFRENGLNTAIKSYGTEINDALLSASGNLFYGPRRRADDESSGSSVDKAAAIVLSEDEYESIIRLDDALNKYFEICGLRIKDVCQSATSDSIIRQAFDKIRGCGFLTYVLYCKLINELRFEIFETFTKIKVNHGLKVRTAPIPFDPRLVDRAASDESKWFYRHREIAGKSLPDWLLKLLLDVSHELELVLYIDLNLTPMALCPDIEDRTLISNFIASEVDIFPLVSGGERVYQYQPDVIMIVPAEIDFVMSEARDRLARLNN